MDTELLNTDPSSAGKLRGAVAGLSIQQLKFILQKRAMVARK
jgi:hypothetical protein